MMSDIQSRLSCAEQSCVGHFKELEVLRLADVKNKSMLADLEKVERRIDKNSSKRKKEKEKNVESITAENNEIELEQLRTLNDFKNQGGVRV